MIQAYKIIDETRKTGIYIWCTKYEQRQDIILCFSKKCPRIRLGKARCPEFVKGLQHLKSLYREGTI